MEAGTVIDPREQQEHDRQAVAELASAPLGRHPRSAPGSSSTVPWGLPTACTVLALAFVIATFLALLVGALLAAIFGPTFDRRYPQSWTKITLQLQAIAVALTIIWLVVRRFRIGLEGLGVRRLTSVPPSDRSRLLRIADLHFPAPPVHPQHSL
jgi:hypothetical protein